MDLLLCILQYRVSTFNLQLYFCQLESMPTLKMVMMIKYCVLSVATDQLNFCCIDFHSTLIYPEWVYMQLLCHPSVTSCCHSLILSERWIIDLYDIVVLSFQLNSLILLRLSCNSKTCHSRIREHPLANFLSHYSS